MGSCASQQGGKRANTLHARTRPAFLANLAALLPFALALAGDEKEQGAEGSAQAIREVGRG